MNNMQKYTKIMYIYKKIQINTLQDKKNSNNETKRIVYSEVKDMINVRIIGTKEYAGIELAGMGSSLFPVMAAAASSNACLAQSFIKNNSYGCG